MLVAILMLNWRRENQVNLRRGCRRILTIFSNIWRAVRQTKELRNFIFFNSCIVIYWKFSIVHCSLLIPCIVIYWKFGIFHCSLLIPCIVIYWNFVITNKWTILRSKYSPHYLAPTCFHIFANLRKCAVDVITNICLL